MFNEIFGKAKQTENLTLNDGSDANCVKIFSMSLSAKTVIIFGIKDLTKSKLDFESLLMNCFASWVGRFLTDKNLDLKISAQFFCSEAKRDSATGAKYGSAPGTVMNVLIFSHSE